MLILLNETLKLTELNTMRSEMKNKKEHIKRLAKKERQDLL
jgi:hypothetical protein